ncbi:hypothetical protein HanIR_Chr11g0557221 [Helianthus annuus]|nr:hypothetical protein HanIR_Chr11g0557221 [Helianthus annuus]
MTCYTLLSDVVEVDQSLLVKFIPFFFRKFIKSFLAFVIRLLPFSLPPATC